MPDADLTKLHLGTKKLHPGLIEHFVVDGRISPQRVRGVFMQAGIVSPKSDAEEDLVGAIQVNLIFLNVFASKNNSFKKPKSPKKKVLSKSPKRSKIATQKKDSRQSSKNDKV